MRFAVIGDPVAHSKSPVMHAAAYRALGLAHTHSYEAVRVTAEELPRIVQSLREGAFDGLNVTVPHKERVLALVDRVDPDAAAIGAANTLARVDGRVVAFNTDAPALAAELQELGSQGGREQGRGMSSKPNLPSSPPPCSFPSRALVLGSGGAARAAVAALERHLGVRDVVVRARTARPGLAPPQPWRPSPESESSTLFVVQATSAGMTGAAPGEAVADAVAWDALPPDAVAIDLVYAPPETPFLRAARARGMRCANGLGMLARQGALALELWLGVPAPLDVMRAALDGLS